MAESEICANCTVYDWPHENVPISRCSNCKFLSYCSTECQREHWKKVHKKQCKTLAGQVEDPVSTHLPDSCPSCKEEQGLDIETRNSQDSPVWGCLVGPGTRCVPKILGKFPSAVESLDMTRKFIPRDEHTVFVMRQIVGKLIRTNPTRLSGPRGAWLASLLDTERMTHISIRHILPTKKFETGYVVRSEFLEALQSSFPGVSSTLRLLGDPFLIWETFKLLTGFLLTSNMHYTHKKMERLNVRADLPTEVQELIDELDTSSQLEETWDSVLDALKARPVHHHSLLDILCAGKREQQCNQCQEPVIIERVFVPFVDEPNSEKPFVTFMRRIYSCPALACQLASRREEEDFQHHYYQVTLVLNTKFGAMGRNHKCDYCFVVGRSWHRCSECKTKVYCSQECQQADWGIHEKSCNKGEASRKVKGGKEERVDAAKEEMMEFITKYEKKRAPIDPRIKKICLDFIKKK